MTDEDLIAAFEDCTLPPTEFHHRNHVRLAWLLLGLGGPLGALARFSEGLRRYAASLGKAGLYHETITWAYLLLIHERRQREGAAPDWEGFARDNPDLLCRQPPILDRYYREETLASELARRTFVLPDRLSS
jgi:hypothetical protein